jgi:hypothetical protein
VVKDFHDLDKGSLSFRYAQDKNGMTIRLPNEPFDLQNIKSNADLANASVPCRLPESLCVWFLPST